jgi:dolichol kinase
MNGLPTVEESYWVEVVRKGIHLVSLSIPVIYAFIPRSTALALLVPLTILFAATDFWRHRHPTLGAFYHRYLGWLLRSHERDGGRKRFNGATYVLLSACLCVLIFPKMIVLTAFSILIISDTAAALVGRRYGSHHFFSKSLEGASAFLVTALLVVAFSPKIASLPGEYLIGAVAALTGTIVEALPIAIDDNLSIPLAVGGVMWLLYATLLPTLNIFALDVL